jgi:superfamily II DNA/RNA helicase
MHGNLSQAQRNRVLTGFRTGRLTVLVATDVVGRGIDVRGVSHVINFDLPEDPAQYVHRIGRTGRMGNNGAAFSFVVPEQSRLLDQIERTISRQLEDDYVEGVEAPARLIFRRPERHGHGRGGPRRGGRPPYRGGGGGGGRPGGPPRFRRDRAPQGAGR